MRLSPQAPQQGELSAVYYDQAFSNNPDWKNHYTASPYYFLWTVIIDRLRQRRSAGILEIACGPGQLASAIYDAEIANDYLGFDFSPVAIQFAQKACPGYKFLHENALETTLFEDHEYDTIVSTEFLEHVEEDLAVLSRIREGVYVIATVPNFPYVSHVRHFTDCRSVADRYKYLFEGFNVVEIPGKSKGQKFFLLEGIKGQSKPILDYA